MNFFDKIRSLSSGSEKAKFTWKVDPHDGLDFIFPKDAVSSPEEYAMKHTAFAIQYAYLKGLVEQELAYSIANGFTVYSSVVADLGEDFEALFDLPSLFNGSYRSRIEGHTGRASFHVSLELCLADGSVLNHYSLSGPFLKLTDSEMYRLTPAEWKALSVLEKHQSLSADQRGEYENNYLIFQLQTAKKAGMQIDLSHFDNIDLIHPDSVGLSLEEMPNGDITLTPAFGGSISVDDIKARLGQIGSDKDQCIFRVKDKFVLLDDKRLEAAKEVLTNPRIPKAQVAKFLESPSAFLNAAIVDFDTGFSLRVHGAERFVHRYYGDVERSGVDWFHNNESVIQEIQKLKHVVKDESDVADIEQVIKDARTAGADTIEFKGQCFDISDAVAVDSVLGSLRESAENGTLSQPRNDRTVDSGGKESATEQAVLALDANDDSVEFSSVLTTDRLCPEKQTFDQSGLNRTPFPHQVEGIQWLLAHFEAAKKTASQSGALLADDMGLGKTYMTLVAVAEWYNRQRDKSEYLKPTLIVAPLSLIENWQNEVSETFRQSPFSDIVVLQSGADLKHFKEKGAGRETRQQFDDESRISDDKIRYSLKIGKYYGHERLDQPERMVLTTYTTLRDYQFSMSRVDWGVVIFDEAQNLKNPNALQTIAASGLKADFKLLASGTPVENSLKDFWCLFDTSTPGLLGEWQDFRARYISPILNATDDVESVKLNVGKELRERVGEYMLRRTKAEKLQGLPTKNIYSADQSTKSAEFMPEILSVMSGNQLNSYDGIIDGVRNSGDEDRRTLVLPSLRKLKVTSIHQDLVDTVEIPQKPKEFLNHALQSCKVASVFKLLKEISDRNEKVIIFSESRNVQAYMSAFVTSVFKVPVEVINGETKAVASKKGDETRKSLIDRWQSQPGFGVIIMSPVAAGTGLTVVGANNVIHLERHWNPAKEAQATDRVYRIGQKRDVNIYLPMAAHPSMMSFDLQLSKLLENKIDLSEAVVANEDVQPADLAGIF